MEIKDYILESSIPTVQAELFAKEIFDYQKFSITAEAVTLSDTATYQNKDFKISPQSMWRSVCLYIWVLLIKEKFFKELLLNLCIRQSEYKV